MASQKISQLPNAAPLTGAELLPAVQSGRDVSVVSAQIAVFVGQAFDSIASAEAAHILGRFFRTSGYYTAGDGGGALYAVAAAQSAGDGKVRSADGTWWQYVPGERGVNVLAFGAKRDAGDNNNGTATGTDATAAIQSAINFALENTLPVVYMPAGVYLTSDTLHMGYGNTFVQIRLIGESGAYASIGAGTTILFTATDRQCVNIQAGRIPSVESIQFVHVLNNWWVNNNVAFSSQAIPTTAAGYVDPVLTLGLDPNAPLACITLDAFAGTAPANPYPQVIYPAFTGFTSTPGVPSTWYGRAQTSAPVIRNCVFRGFPVAYASGLNTDAQGDFLSFRDNQVYNYAYGVAIANSQSRNVEIREVVCEFGHTLITNLHFGSGPSGQFNGPFDNISGSQCYQLFDFGSGVGAVVMNDPYLEDSVRIGVCGGTGSLPTGLHMIGGRFDFGETFHGQTPRAYIEASGNIDIRFDALELNSDHGVTALVFGAGARVTLGRDCLLRGGLQYDSTSGAALARAVNYGGGYILNGSTASPHATNKISGYSKARYIISGTGEDMTAWSNDEVQAYPPNSYALLREGVQSFRDGSGRKWEILNRPANQSFIAKSGLGSLAQTTDTLTFTYPHATPDSNPNAFLIEAGDLLYDSASVLANQGTIYAVTSVTGGISVDYSITAKQQNNCNTFTGTLVPNVNVVTSGGFFLLIKTGLYIPTTVYYGNFTSGQATVENIHKGNGSGAAIATDLPPSMLLWSDDGAVDPLGENTVAVNTYIGVATNGSPGSMTLVSDTGGSINATGSGRIPIMPVLVGRRAETSVLFTTLSDQATVTPDFGLATNFTWTLGATGRTLANPTNVRVGQRGRVYLIEDSTGSRTITTWGTSYKFSGSTKPTLTTAANAIDFFDYVVRDATHIDCVFTADSR